MRNAHSSLRTGAPDRSSPFSDGLINRDASLAANRRRWSSAAGSMAAWLRFLMVAGAGVAADLWAKHAAFAALGSGLGARRVVAVPHVLTFQTTLNGGAVFGLGQGFALSFIVISLVAMGFVVYVFMSSFRSQWIMHSALGLILAGAMGNLYDRIFNHGMVRDFILLHYWPWIFNVADALLCVGVPLLILCWRFQVTPRQRARKSKI